MAQHLKVLGALARGRHRCGEAVGQARAFDRLLRHPGNRLGRRDPCEFQHGRRDVADMVELVANAAAVGDALGVVQDQRVAHAATVGVLLVALERRVAGHRPAQRVVVVQVRLANLVDVRQVFRQRVTHTVEIAQRVDRAKGRALLARAVVGDQRDHRVVEFPGLRQVIQQPTDLQVGVLEHTGKRCLQLDREPALVIAERIPGFDPGIALGQQGVGRHDAHGFLTRQSLAARQVPALLEHRHVLVDKGRWRMVGRMLSAQAQVEEEWLVRRDHLLGPDEANRGVDDVLGQVIALAIGGIDVMVVKREFWMKLVGLAFQKAVEAVEPTLQRPLVEGSRWRGLESRR